MFYYVSCRTLRKGGICPLCRLGADSAHGVRDGCCTTRLGPCTHVRMHARNVFGAPRQCTETGGTCGRVSRPRACTVRGSNALRCLTSSCSADRRRARPSRSANAAGRVPAASCLFCGRNWRYRQLCLRHGRPTQLLACNQLCVHTTKSSRIEIPPADICAARG